MFAAALLLGVIVVCQLVALAWITVEQARTHSIWLEALDNTREAYMAHTADLLQRIQAPEAAVVQHQILTSPRPDPSAPSFDDDAGFWESKEDMAARLANER